MNLVILTGRICAKPEAYTTQSGICRIYKLKGGKPA